MSPHAAEIAEVVIEEQVSVVTTGAGNPSPFMDAWASGGIHVIPVVPSVAIARRLAQKGATAIIAEGGEAGGHVGETTTMALIPQVADVVDVPLIAAGGIADGRGIAAAFALGASGVQIGTRFLVAKECAIHPYYKELVLKAKDRDTVSTGKRLGHPVRSLKTPFSRRFAALEYDSSVTDEALEALGVGALQRAIQGDEQEGCFVAGQIAGLIMREQTAAEMIEEMFGQAETVLQDIAKNFIRE